MTLNTTNEDKWNLTFDRLLASQAKSGLSFFLFREFRPFTVLDYYVSKIPQML